MGGNVFVKGGMVRAGAGLAPSDILVRDGRIDAMGQLEPPAGADVIDASGCAVVAGFVNAHAHSGENLNPGLYENLPLDLWFVDSHQVTRTSPADSDEIYARTLLGAAQMLRTGTTCVGDFLYEAPQITSATLEPVIRAYRDIGLRVTLILGIADRPYLESLPWGGRRPVLTDAEANAPTRREIMDLIRQAVRDHHDPEGLVRIGIGPSAPQRCTPELLHETMNVARELDLVWHTHVLETKSQACTAQDLHSHSFVRSLDEQGMLGPRTSIVHAVWLDSGDISVLQATGCNVIHCLASNLRLGDGVSPLPRLRERGVNVALGTDGRGCCERLDMLDLTRLTASLHKAWGEDYARWPTAAEALAMATEGGARCLGMGTAAGMLEPGAWADLVLVDLSTTTFTPLNDFTRQLVYGGDSTDIRAVLLGGRMVVDRGRVLTIDEEALRRQVAKLGSAASTAAPGGSATAMRSLVDGLWHECERRPLPIRSYLGPLP